MNIVTLLFDQIFNNMLAPFALGAGVISHHSFRTYFFGSVK